MARNGNGTECLLFLPNRAEFRPLRNALREAAEAAEVKLKHVTAEDDGGPFEGSSLIPDMIMRADIIVGEASEINASAAYAMGLANAQGKPVLLLMTEGQRPRSAIPGALYLMYERGDAGIAKLRRVFRRALDDFKRSPRSFTPSFVPLKPPPTPFVDLGKLEPREFENLCFELLSQIGFRRVEWGKDLPGADAVATLKKKDPDGFANDPADLG